MYIDTYLLGMRLVDTGLRYRLASSMGMGLVRITAFCVVLFSILGKCLSMHQPWASLLVAGIKRYVGGSTWMLLI